MNIGRKTFPLAAPRVRQLAPHSARNGFEADVDGLTAKMSEMGVTTVSTVDSITNEMA